MGNETNRLAKAAEKRRRALELRRAGWTYPDIAIEVGWKNKGSAYKAVQQELRAIPREAAKELLTLELERLDDLLAGSYTNARQGDPASLSGVMKILEQRQRLLGLYDRKEEDTTGKEVQKALKSFSDAMNEALGGDDKYGSGTVREAG